MVVAPARGVPPHGGEDSPTGFLAVGPEQRQRPSSQRLPRRRTGLQGFELGGAGGGRFPALWQVPGIARLRPGWPETPTG